MNAPAHALGMDHTSDTDPSGFDPSTASTAADQRKTGSDPAAGGCPAFFTDVTAGRRVTAVGVVLGQGQGSPPPHNLDLDPDHEPQEKRWVED